MTALQWDQVGTREYETGVDRGVLFLPDNEGNYEEGVAWNGLTTVTESPSGAESNPQYADNIKYLNLLSAEEFGATVEAFTYPDEFAECDGTYTPSKGVAIGQQGRRIFGMAYRTLKGNDTEGTEHGYKIHLLYGAQAAPSEKEYASVNDSPEAITFSWELTTSPVPVDGHKPTALVIIDSTEVEAGDLEAFEDILYGSSGVDPRLPLPDEIIALFGTAGSSPTAVRLTGANAPTYNSGTHVVTLPTVAGVQWKVNGQNKAPGAQPALTSGQTAEVTAVAADGNHFIQGDDDWTFDF